MEQIYEKQSYELSKQNYLDGRTLICLYHWEKDDKLVGAKYLPHDADFELCFKLCNYKILRFFLGEKEFRSLLTDDISRIKIHSALQAEKDTVARVKTNGKSEQKRICAYLDNLEKSVKENDEKCQKIFAGEGK